MQVMLRFGGGGEKSEKEVVEIELPEELIEILKMRARTIRPILMNLDPSLCKHFSKLHGAHINALKKGSYLLAHEIRGDIARLLIGAENKTKEREPASLAYLIEI